MYGPREAAIYIYIDVEKRIELRRRSFDSSPLGAPRCALYDNCPAVVQVMCMTATTVGGMSLIRCLNMLGTRCAEPPSPQSTAPTTKYIYICI